MHNDGPIDWNRFLAKVKKPTTYDPPQLKPGVVPLGTCCNIFTQTSGLCVGSPCCCAGCILCLCDRRGEHVSMEDPEPWFLKMLTTGASRNCPEHLKGVWWLADDQMNQESVVTLQNGDWAPDGKTCVLRIDENWSRTATCFGAINNVSVAARRPTMGIEFSPDGKWMNIGGYWAYIPSNGEEFLRLDGSKLQYEPGDMIRMSWRSDDPSTELTYQYIFRRVSYLGEDGNLVKTGNWDRLMERVAAGKARLAKDGCGWFVCSSENPAYSELYTEINPTQVIRYPSVLQE